MSFWKKKDNLIITGFVVAFFIGLAAWQDGGCITAAFSQRGGASSDAFKIPFVDQDQKQVTLEQFKGKPLIINFWATWCPVCVKKMATLNAFAQKFQSQGGQVITISEDKSLGAVRAYLTRNNYSNLGGYLDASGKVMDAFGASGLPTSVFIDASGKVVNTISGGFDWGTKEVAEMVETYFGIKVPE